MNTTSTDPDALLMEALADGDREALGILYDRHVGSLLAVGVRMLRNHAAAEDLAHDVLLEAWRKAETYSPERGSVRAWLLVRMRSRALDLIRSARYQREVATEITPERSQPGVEQRASGADRQRVTACLADLPDSQRAVIELGYFSGLSSTEIADRLGVPVGTVKSRVAAGLRKLRTALGAGDLS